MARTCQNRRGGSGAPLKQRFVRLLHELLKRNGIRQKDLGRKLGVTASAASQILNGAMTPSKARLEQLLELLKPEVEESQLLQDMAFWLRSGRREMPSPANRRLFLLRCRSGLSEADLARTAGIDAKRLHALENQPGAVPTDLELVALSAVLGEGAAEIAADARNDRLLAEAADSGRTAMLPQIGIDELRNYDGSERIGDFAARYARTFAECVDVFPGVAAVCVIPAAAAGLDGSGVLKMTLGEKNRRGMEKILLCLDTTGKLFIRGWGLLTAAGTRRRAVWSIPLFEISYAPGRIVKS